MTQLNQPIEISNHPQSVHAPKPRRQRPGRKPSATSLRRLPAGRGGARLRSSINTLVGLESDRIARALIDKTLAGNMTGARLLVELSGAQNAPPEKKKKKRPGPSWAELLASEPEWNEEEWDEHMARDASKLPPTKPDRPDEPK